MEEHPDNGTGPDSNGVRTELQADCFAGAWVGDMTEQVDENGVPFLEAADASSRSPTRSTPRRRSATTTSSRSPAASVNPESWTHGSSEQRQRWFETGYQRRRRAPATHSAVPGGSL